MAGLTQKEIDLANSLISAATASPDTTDQDVASAACALLAGAICGMLGLGSEEVSEEEYTQYATYINARLEEAVLALIAEISAPQEGN